MELLVRETNRYYEQQNDLETNRDKKWIDTNVREMKKFLALIMLMGLVRKTEKDEYWSSNPLICTPIFRTVMTRHRFRQLWRYWHFSNNEACQDRLDKVKPVITHFQTTFQTVYKPVKELSLDESIIPWRGRLSFRTYNPAKIIKYGILVRSTFRIHMQFRNILCKRNQITRYNTFCTITIPQFMARSLYGQLLQ